MCRRVLSKIEEAQKSQKKSLTSSKRLTNSTDEDIKVDFTSRSSAVTAGSAKRLTLEVCAVPKIGIRARLSGGDSVMPLIGNDGMSRSSIHLCRNVEKLLSSVRDPFCLSVSDSLLSASIGISDF